MKKYGILLIGCGHIGTQHIEDIYYRDNIDIIAVVDTNEEKAALTASKYGAKDYGADYKAFINDPRVDIVIIATYTATHLPLLRESLANGKHVLCEKPIAGNYEDGKEFYELVKSASQKVLVALILRHNKSYNTIKSLIDAGEIGELKVMRIAQSHHVTDWERHKALLEDTSPVVDCGVHYFDVMQWFTGAKICEVSGIGNKVEEDSPRANYTLATVKLNNGCIGYFEAGWSNTIASLNVKEFIGTKGRITLTLKDLRYSDREEGDLISIYHRDNREYKTLNVDSEYKDMNAQIQTLIDMIENGTPGSPTIDEVFSAFYATIKADEAIEKGTVIKI
ncbi:MAG: hypothetical protein A2Y17_04690 [Clostridiales bacterium GWF2_38_85]|nr:MAG: hypothetical protein A2Y17_04690 [Clostridiales bacterium GWF2_38_85]HBL84415.1 hypothetical protein [Clostridiales bacterium]